jgi:hypothetical protein
VTYALVKWTALPVVAVYAVCNFIDLFKCLGGAYLVGRGGWAKNITADATEPSSVQAES